MQVIRALVTVRLRGIAAVIAYAKGGAQLRLGAVMTWCGHDLVRLRRATAGVIQCDDVDTPDYGMTGEWPILMIRG